MKNQRIHIGTSGWHYPHWRGTFYPPEMKSGQFFEYYAQNFQTVEINNSFYHLPLVKTFQQWKENSPPDFIFALKASRFLTHMKKLKDVDAALSEMLERFSALGAKLGPIVFQLPPRWRVNAPRLAEFLSKLPRRFRYAIEFRNPTWHVPEIYTVLEKFNVAFCIFDFGSLHSPAQITSDMVYLRLHGPEDTPYSGLYSSRQLTEWADSISAWAGQVKAIYCYFDNDQAGYAARNAADLQHIIAS